MTVALRFARGAAAGHANSMASLALVRALTHYLLSTNRLHPDEVELIRQLAMDELAADPDDPANVEARLVVLQEFP